jgi:hypothetical protein
VRTAVGGYIAHCTTEAAIVAVVAVLNAAIASYLKVPNFANANSPIPWVFWIPGNPGTF